MSNTSLLGAYGSLGNSSLLFRNKVINGNFDIWQRGTSQTGSGYGSDDRWENANSVSTKTHSQQAFTLGQTDVPGNPQYFSRTVVSSVAGAGNNVLKVQKIESVSTLAGQTATLSFWAKADAPKNMAVEFIQNFGTGGSPSVRVTGIGVTTISLTTSWKYYTVTANLPSIVGKTLGTSGNDFLQIGFWFDAGSSLDARTNSLGQQSGTFDIAQVQLEAGPVATPFEHRPVGLELQLCQRYYYIIPFNFISAPIYNNSGNCVATWFLPTPMRVAPVQDVTLTTSSFRYVSTSGSGASVTSLVATYSKETSFGVNVTISGRTTVGFANLITVNDPLGLSAEL